MKKKYILIFIIIVLVLFIISRNWWKTEDLETKTKKTDFYLETENFSDFSNNYTLEKTSKIDSESEISVNTETYWKLNSINLKEWDKVSVWQVLANLTDTSWNITISYKQAQIALEQSKNNYESNKISLDKAVFDAELNLETIKLNYETLEKTTAENLKQAKNSLDNSNLSNTNSQSNLNLTKLDENIKKLEFDLETTKTSNQESLKSYLNSLQKEVDNLKNLTTDTTDFWDKLFYITWKYNKDNNVDDYFWAKDSTQKNETKISLQNLISFKNDELNNINIDSLDDLEQYSEIIKKWYSLNIEFLQKIEKTMKNSIDSIWTLSESQISAYWTKIDWYQSTAQNLNSAFVSLENQINTFLNTYKKNEESLEKQIELTKSDKKITEKDLKSGELNSEVSYNKTLINSNESLESMKISLKNAENALKIAKANREVSLKNLKNAIDNSKVSLEKASIDYGKFTIKSPISWVITSIDWDIWQTYNSGTKLFTIVSDTKNKLYVYLTANEVNKIKIWEKVLIKYRNETFTGSIFSKSSLADSNLNYKTTISIPQKINLIWWIADIDFKLKSTNKLIPINSVNILETNNDGTKRAEIQVFNWEKIEKKIVELWEVYATQIELLTKLPAETQIILNDTSAYNKEKQVLKLKTENNDVKWDNLEKKETKIDIEKAKEMWL